MHAYFSLINYHQVFKLPAAAHRTYMMFAALIAVEHDATVEADEPRLVRIAGVGRRRPVVRVNGATARRSSRSWPSAWMVALRFCPFPNAFQWRR